MCICASPCVFLFSLRRRFFFSFYASCSRTLASFSLLLITLVTVFSFQAFTHFARPCVLPISYLIRTVFSSCSFLQLAVGRALLFFLLWHGTVFSSCLTLSFASLRICPLYTRIKPLFFSASRFLRSTRLVFCFLPLHCIPCFLRASLTFRGLLLSICL